MIIHPSITFNFFPDSVFDLMETEVNRFATQTLDTTADLPPRSRHCNWKDTDSAEMKAYVALNIAMGLRSKPNISDYLSSYWLMHTPFRNIVKKLLSAFVFISTFQ